MNLVFQKYMRPGWYNFFFFAGTAAAWTAWGMVVTQYYPTVGGFMPFAYFFVCLFLALLGTMYLAGFFLEVRFIGRLTIPQAVRSSTRQAMLFSSLLVTALALQGWDLLTWYNILMLVALLTFIELLFITRQPSR